MSTDLHVQVAGLLACGLTLGACLRKNDRDFKTLIVAGCLLWAAHNYALGATVAALLSIVTAARCALSIDAQDRRLIPLFFTIYIAIACAHADSWIDWLPVATALVGTLSFFCLKGPALRAAHCLGCPLWIVHDLSYGSIGGVISQSCTLAFSLYTIMHLPETRTYRARLLALRPRGAGILAPAG